MSYPFCYLGPTCQLELFFAKKCPKQPELVCPFYNIGANACPMVAFSGLYESHKPPPSGKARDSTAPSWWSSKWPAKMVHFASLFCRLLPWRPLGQYGASSCPMAASSGFRCSGWHAPLGDAACTASTPPHGHRNGLQRRLTAHRCRYFVRHYL